MTRQITFPHGKPMDSSGSKKKKKKRILSDSLLSALNTVIKLVVVGFKDSHSA